MRRASVSVANESIANISQGWLILLGVGENDQQENAKFLAEKILNLRLFSDVQGKFNLSALDINAQLLVVSQFTLFADLTTGRRPSFKSAAKPELAKNLYETFISSLEASKLIVKQGIFGADMTVSLENDGPVTILLDTDELKPKQPS